MKIPTRKKSFELMDKYGMYDNIKEHVKMVEKVAVFLVEKLQEIGFEIDKNLVSRAALLHDLGKVTEIEQGGNHGEIGKEILIKEGYKELGKLCGVHCIKKETVLKTWEEKILNYADCRVMHNNIVSRQERFDDLKKRYKDDIFSRPKQISLETEKEIFNQINIKPEDILKLIK